MQTHVLRVSDGCGQLEDVRTELMIFTDVLEVFSTGRADALVVVCSGRPRPAEWERALRAAGYSIPARHHPRPVASGLGRDAGADAAPSDLDPPHLRRSGNPPFRRSSSRPAPPTVPDVLLHGVV